MPMIPLDTSIEAEYADGFVLSETERDDVSSYKENANVFYDVLHKLPEDEHGALVRLSCFWNNNRYSLDWSVLPATAEPVRLRYGYCHFHLDTGETESGFSGVDFGFKYVDDDGKEQREVLELR